MVILRTAKLSARRLNIRADFIHEPRICLSEHYLTSKNTIPLSCVAYQAQGERRDFSYVRSGSLKWLSIGLADSTMPSTPSLSLEERRARREQHRTKQREENILRAEKMHLARIEAKSGLFPISPKRRT